MNIQPIDRAIVAQLREEIMQPATAIGRAIGVKATVVKNRIKQMQSSGLLHLTIANHDDDRRTGLPAIITVDVAPRYAVNVEQFLKGLTAGKLTFIRLYRTMNNRLILEVTGNNLQSFGSVLDGLGSLPGVKNVSIDFLFTYSTEFP